MIIFHDRKALSQYELYKLSLSNNKTKRVRSKWISIRLKMKSSLETKKRIVPELLTKFTKKNLQRNLSLNVKDSNVFEPRSPRKIIEKKKQSENSYISKAFSYIENGCYDPKTGLIKLDGDYGDYRMRIFRKKDKFKYYNEISSIFDDKDFVQSIWSYADCGINKSEDTKQTKSSIEEPASPTSPKKNFRHQRARMALKRQNSILSPLRQNQPEKKLKLGNSFVQENQQLNKKLNEIFMKHAGQYLNLPVQNEEDQDKNALRKGVEQQLRQKQGHLFYRSIPQYMAEKWFKTIDKSTPDGNKVEPYVPAPPVQMPEKKPKNKRTHLFRFLQHNCEFNISKLNKSMGAS